MVSQPAAARRWHRGRPRECAGLGNAGGRDCWSFGSFGHGFRIDPAESVTTVVVAFAANLLIALAKSVAAVVTASASMLAEAAHFVGGYRERGVAGHRQP
jgi:hypothetical protein